jgi:hypothetical protein
MAQQKTLISVRLNPDLLAEVRQSPARDNRSLTNFIETALRVHGVVGHPLEPVCKDNKNQ